ncbi:MAG: hypothetical protein JG777_2928 [Clostridia bacterium]|jgi:hypothetical protein|nr:hypothetical protein [Clostridia bacterium]
MASQQGDINKMKKRKHKRKKQNNDYINEFIEWQNHQYDPGYYTGGRIPPYIKKPERPKLFGWTLLIAGICSGLVAIIAFIHNFTTGELLSMLVAGFVITIQIVAGIRLLKR